MTTIPDVSSFFAKKVSSPYIMQQTMVRVKDPIVSLTFYTDVLGMNLLSASDFPQWGFSVYFVGYVDPAILPADTKERWTFVSKIPGTVELTWNHGSENSDGNVYNTGNSDATGTADGQKVRAQGRTPLQWVRALFLPVRVLTCHCGMMYTGQGRLRSPWHQRTRRVRS